MTEPGVTLTDYALSIECFVFVWLLSHSEVARKSLRNAFALFFAALSLGSLAGGTVHGFFLNETSPGFKILWPTTLLCLGLAAFAAWWAGSEILFQGSLASLIKKVAATILVIYMIIVFMVSQKFLVVIVHHVPAAIFLLMAYGVVYARKRAPAMLIGIFGLVLTFIAAVVQQSKLAIHTLYFNHNAFYHVLQAISLFMIFWAARWLLKEEYVHD